KGLKKNGAGSPGSPSSIYDEALAKLIVSELATQNERAIVVKKEERAAFLETRRRESYDQLIGDALRHMEELRAEIKAK
nr:hypothetical protein [Tanacetum cinerariifolium]